MISINLSGKSILITGALGAIAEPMVRKLVEAGAKLILLDIKPEDAAAQTLREWKIPTASYVYFPTDITDSAALARVVTESFRHFPALDTVLGHAGGCELHPFATTSEADYDRIFRFNYFAQVNLARAVFAQWIERKISGHLIFTSSYVARMPHTRIPSYEDPAYREFVLRVSLGRRNSPESIADAFVFLCSPLANEINGQILSPDYGTGIGNRL